ncbi:TIM21-domain-containing protein [Collybia nuda]|uniref:Mitochondrial import inner membrane translocase subunit Tim21 n=1 Tax=Collybia nuda TaxID=64659 RepID=A0A9P6CFZ0_9AGAR|nr:TIM21-domain-containing protein [Collybia nuda]
MNITNFLFRTHAQRPPVSLSRSLPKPHRTFSPFAKRRYATHRDGESSSLLSQSLDTKQRPIPRGDSVGPFQLGLAQSSLRKGEKLQSWSQLSTSGKVLRTTARTTNLTVILLGAGLSALLIYSLTSELFSKNSPTVLYGDACERIKASPKVAKYLNGPLSFHNNPPSAIRPRHRNRHVISQIMVDAYGQEHMIMTFYVQGRPPGVEPVPSDLSYLESAAEWAQGRLFDMSEMTLDESIAWSKDRACDLWTKTKRLFRYLSGAPLPSPPLYNLPSDNTESQKPEDGSGWSFSGMFSSLRNPRGGPAESKPKSDGRTHTEGQVHANFIRNNDGYFIFRYLLIDMPSSRDLNPVRVFVERAPGVRDNEPVMRWNS